ncbi:HNH endonuclease [Loktanella salsilacus]|uniref:HNH endonuclease n=1 Tax=Loktanella salsilacus TaxID=195913 RepID=UPI0020B6E3A6|nr:HNH endonuclease [Loktanella salsilacus]UTH44939.1 HNH endonuclease [Loktanella salsilacus]
MDDFTYRDESEVWLAKVLSEDYEEALARAASLVAAAQVDENGCLVTNTTSPRKTRFHGHQLPAYRFVYCVLNRAVIGWKEVVRHRCHNRLCLNPEHLVHGSRADNKRDDWDYWANGVDYDLL